MIRKVDFPMSPKDLPLHVLFLAKQVLGFLIQAAKELFLPAHHKTAHQTRVLTVWHKQRQSEQAGKQTQTPM